jgi:hypothetical protein
MLVARNRCSGKYFIVIEHLTDGKLFCVNPECRIREFEKKIFDEVFDEGKDRLISNGFITKNQIKKLQNYNADREDEKIDSLKIMFEEMTHWQREALLKELREIKKNIRN